ncbi:tRNA pseudouridine synthase A [Taibaiella soli]|uniref:tRNA pseudouridine synthase A n=1 Tax=Taibaiella soli TaxID=1649169 RepID=A0A2W2AE37_9BACT|nr:tRNA pseudouridine synthase A [Taibaiella soli]PZF73725.1 tRNA pseudouridine(38-40) synthase TruA [Taibaiella soli]
MKRYFLEVMYNGTAFHGSQLQGDIPTVQLAVNKALATLMRRPVETFGASRTDEGVHALSNFYHFDNDGALNPQLLYKMNAILQDAISIKAIYEALDPETNARFAATSRQYRYRIYGKKNPFLHERALYHPYRLDKNVLDQTAAALKEYSNFETFSKRNTQTKTFICNIMDAHWEDHGNELHFVVEANRFLRGMVRGLVGTQLQAGRGRFDVDGFRKIIEAQDCTKADFSVTGHGLYLEQVKYPSGLLVQIQ